MTGPRFSPPPKAQVDNTRVVHKSNPSAEMMELAMRRQMPNLDEEAIANQSTGQMIPDTNLSQLLSKLAIQRIQGFGYGATHGHGPSVVKNAPQGQGGHTYLGENND